jgi:hypothetical protein
MIFSESTDQIFTALAAAQGQFKDMKQSGYNPHFKSKFSSMSDRRKATKEALSANGLCLSSSSILEDGRYITTTLLGHKSGQWMKFPLSMKPQQDNPQAVGSVISYARRYGAEAILDLDASDDDDGEAAMTPKISSTPPKQDSFDIFNSTDKVQLAKLRGAIPAEVFNEVVTILNNKPFTKLNVDDAVSRARTGKKA